MKTAATNRMIIYSGLAVALSLVVSCKPKAPESGQGDSRLFGQFVPADGAKQCRLEQNPLRRLTNREIVNTLFDIFINEHNRGSGEFEAALKLLPKEKSQGDFVNTPELQIFDLRHIEGMLALQREVFSIIDKSPTDSFGRRPYFRIEAETRCGLKSNDLSQMNQECAQKLGKYYADLMLRGSSQAGRSTGVLSKLLEKSPSSPYQALQRYIGFLLSHPNFLFRDLAPDQKGDTPRTSDQIAESLALAFWGTADTRHIKNYFFGRTNPHPVDFSQESSLKYLVVYLLQDKRSKAMVKNFANEWLGLAELEDIEHGIDDEVANNLGISGGADQAKKLLKAMRYETEQFVEFLVRGENDLVSVDLQRSIDQQNRPAVRSLVDGKFSFLNAELASHYGEQAGNSQRSGPGFVKDIVPITQRQGIMTHGSILALGSHGKEISVVLRGKWIMDRLLCQPAIGDIPDNAGDLLEQAVSGDQKAEDIMAGDGMNQLRIFSQESVGPTCRGCHAGGYNLIGLALEPFDALGKFRPDFGKLTTPKQGRDVFAVAPLPSWQPYDWQKATANPHKRFNNFSSLLQYLLASNGKFYECVAAKLVAYISGQSFDGALDRGSDACKDVVRSQVTDLLNAGNPGQRSFVDVFARILRSKLYLHHGGFATASTSQTPLPSSPSQSTGAPQSTPSTGGSSAPSTNCTPDFPALIAAGNCAACHQGKDYVSSRAAMEKLLTASGTGYSRKDRKIHFGAQQMPPTTSSKFASEAEKYFTCINKLKD